MRNDEEARGSSHLNASRARSRDHQSFRIIVPVRNGGSRWLEAARALANFAQDPSQIVVVDSESSDGSADAAQELGFAVYVIPADTFNHGGTRQWAVDEFATDKEIAVFLTQDAVIESNRTIPALLETFRDPQVGAAFGRQLPHTGAGLFESHAAMFNYGPTSSTRTIGDAEDLGIKTAYLSNSFAAFRVSALLEIGGFPNHLILGEDVYAAAKLLSAGHSIRYCAEARVRHSHHYSIWQECQRYFDFGVMHTQIPDLLARFGRPEGEGVAFVWSELRFIATLKPLRLAECLVRNAAKYTSYRLGRSYRALPRGIIERLSMTKVYWRKPAPNTQEHATG